MIVTTFDYGYNVRVTDAEGNDVWTFSTAKGEWVSKELPDGDYTVWVGMPEGGKTIQAKSNDLVGVEGVYPQYSLHDAHDKYRENSKSPNQLHVATFEYGLNVNVTDEEGNSVWSFSTADTEWVSKRLKKGQYTVTVEDSGRTHSIKTASTDVVGVIGTDFKRLVLRDARDLYEKNQRS